jgi:hypothetical protein
VTRNAHRSDATAIAAAPAATSKLANPPSKSRPLVHHSGETNRRNPAPILSRFAAKDTGAAGLKR